MTFSAVARGAAAAQEGAQPAPKQEPEPDREREEGTKTSLAVGPGVVMAGLRVGGMRGGGEAAGLVAKEGQEVLRQG